MLKINGIFGTNTISSTFSPVPVLPTMPSGIGYKGKSNTKAQVKAPAPKKRKVDDTATGSGKPGNRGRKKGRVIDGKKKGRKKGKRVTSSSDSD